MLLTNTVGGQTLGQNSLDFEPARMGIVWKVSIVLPMQYFQYGVSVQIPKIFYYEKSKQDFSI